LALDVGGCLTSKEKAPYNTHWTGGLVGCICSRIEMLNTVQIPLEAKVLLKASVILPKFNFTYNAPPMLKENQERDDTCN